jgi:hypothetical protein
MLPLETKQSGGKLLPIRTSYVWISEQILFALYVINSLVFITEVESVYCAVRTESLYKTDTFRP